MKNFFNMSDRDFEFTKKSGKIGMRQRDFLYVLFIFIEFFFQYGGRVSSL